jgi:hypothetical protein
MVAPVRYESYRDERGRHLLKRTLVLQSVCGGDCEGATIGRARHWYRSPPQTRDDNDAILSGSAVPGCCCERWSARSSSSCARKLGCTWRIA